MSPSHLSEHSFFPMQNTIQNYAWGSISSMRELFGFKNELQEPQAEVWMGSHPKGCSMVTVDQHLIYLSELINKNKSAYLSTDIAQEFGELPFLFKILAAEKALSVQVHPNKHQAEIGFAKEEQAKIPLTAGHRNYKDSNHKPELVYAISEYKAMNGFREYSEIIALFRQVNCCELSDLVEDFGNNLDAKGLETFFHHLLTLNEQAKHRALKQLLTYAATHQEQVECALVIELSHQYPNDIGLFSALLLNLITLQPGEAMYLNANTPHAYIKGTGLEIMANSDNVLRAGLTPKHIDVTELIACTTFSPIPFNQLLLSPSHTGSCDHYDIPVSDFNFNIFHGPQQEQVLTSSAEIVMAIDDDLTLTSHKGERLSLTKGQSVFIPAYIGHYVMSSNGRVARAFN
ncbi:mannose-6-phosphate isomerase, class I [Vibrio methylphosphonaticus]|uniref:mannose-6-phosphate isomerase, class I n=1 Tax=Vibrio methylphosphonaticus TaxID=2946866 RepID=UPI00202A26B1|nr:mannose-6-phosphate isomerase, class I [Vibrio methylphosphonaticus]MCL9776542.1 mannose-6-phosphate isomerase, class I [Vibrio methylphosphonaticus]